MSLEELRALMDARPWMTVLLAVPFSWLVALCVNGLLRLIVPRLVHRTRSTLDDELLPLLRRPLSASIVLIGVGFAIGRIELSEGVAGAIEATLVSLAVLYWTVTGLRGAHIVLQHLGEAPQLEDASGGVQRRMLPFLEIVARVVILGGAIYLLLLAWGINVSAWVASAGIVGIAVGLAAQDTLANLIAGLSILVDAPYELGDYLILDGELEGEVTRISFRSTRLLTLDDVEIVIPNMVLASGRITNLTGGSGHPYRMEVPIGVAYGSDLDQVEEILLGVGEALDDVLQHPRPDVRFVGFGASSLDHVLRVWLASPDRKIEVLHQANRLIYAGLNEAGIEIPFNKLDVTILQESDS